MHIYEALYTTRAMRRLKPDPIPLDVQARILDAAIRAPSGGNTQQWRFLLVDDPGVRNQLGPIYRDCVQKLWATVYKERVETARATPDEPESKATLKMVASVGHQADNWETIPLLFFAFAPKGNSGSSIYPSIWSAMLAARAEGIGSCITTILGFREQEVLDLLGVPSGENWSMTCCIPMGYPTGRWGIAERQPVHEVSYRNRWGTPVGFEVDQPLWPGTTD